MIPRSTTECQTESHIIHSDSPFQTCPSIAATVSWQQQLARSRITIEQLLKSLDISPEHYQSQLLKPEKTKNFPLRVTESFIARMQPRDINDPLLRQVLPINDELVTDPNYGPDPLNEKEFNAAPGFIQKYHGRALLIVTQACAIHCRYCFRKNFPYSENRPGLSGWQNSLDQLRKDASIREIIFSGGDPLAVNDEYLSQLTESIATIPHIKRLRIHTRLPIVLPSRIDDAMIDWLSRWQGQKVIVIHCNHPNELNDEVQHALNKLAKAKVTLLNQAVLLKGINDRAETQIELAEKLFAFGVLPYYLHMLDKVTGAQHFEVSRQNALQLSDDIRQKLPGFLVPRLVEEIAGAHSKTPVYPLI